MSAFITLDVIFEKQIIILLLSQEAASILIFFVDFVIMYGFWTTQSTRGIVDSAATQSV